MPRSGDDTRRGLIQAAKELYHRQGYHRTTLADVANAAGIPLGSVYYHFRTKEALVEAVIQAHGEDIRRKLAEWDQLGDPRQRLRAWLANSARYRTLFVRYGCPYGTLAAELDKDDGGLTTMVGELLQLYVEWAERQFRLMSADGQAHDRALALVASVQGAYLLTNALRDPDVLERQTQRLAAELDAVA